MLSAISREAYATDGGESEGGKNERMKRERRKEVRMSSCVLVYVCANCHVFQGVAAVIKMDEPGCCCDWSAAE